MTSFGGQLCAYIRFNSFRTTDSSLARIIQVNAIALNTSFREHSATGKHEMQKFEAWRAGFGGVPGNRQLVSWLEDIPAKTGFG